MIIDWNMKKKKTLHVIIDKMSWYYKSGDLNVFITFLKVILELS